MRKLTSLLAWFSFFCLVYQGVEARALCTTFLKQTQVPDSVIALPGWGALNHCELAGMLSISEKTLKDSKKPQLFYWFVASPQNNPDTPIVLWLNGGPGASSLYGFFLENGPYRVTKEGTLKKRVEAWSSKAHYLVIDQPAGVGLSYGDRDSFKNEAETIEQLAYALTVFFKKYPSLKSHPFYLAGESYAGKTLPALALALLSQPAPLKIKGLLIGDGWINPTIQQGANGEYAYTHGLIDVNDVKTVNALYRHCQKLIAQKFPSTRKANRLCGKIQNYIKKQSGGLNLANIETFSEPDDSDMTSYLNREEVRKALHVPNTVGQFNTFNDTVSDVLEVGIQNSMGHLYPILLEKGIRVLIYNGLADGKDANFIGLDRWLRGLSWPHQTEFNKMNTKPLYLNNRVVGYIKSTDGLTQVKILHAGHIAIADKPLVLLSIFRQFIEGIQH